MAEIKGFPAVSTAGPIEALQAARRIDQLPASFQRYQPLAPLKRAEVVRVRPIAVHQFPAVSTAGPIEAAARSAARRSSIGGFQRYQPLAPLKP